MMELGTNVLQQNNANSQKAKTLPYRSWKRHVLFSQDPSCIWIGVSAYLGPWQENGAVGCRLLLTHRADEGFQPLGRSVWEPEDADTHSFKNDFTDLNLTSGGDHGSPGLRIKAKRLGTVSPSRSVSLGHDGWASWRAEPGLIASMNADLNQDGLLQKIKAHGYQSTIRGCWDWQSSAGWIHGFMSSKESGNKAPEYSVLFMLFQPYDQPDRHEAAVVVWRNGRLSHTFSRRYLQVGVSGQLDRDKIRVVPFPARLMPSPAVSPPPLTVAVSGRRYEREINFNFIADNAVRVLLPSETGTSPGIVHEVVGQIDGDLRIGKNQFHLSGQAVFEFGGGMPK